MYVLVSEYPIWSSMAQGGIGGLGSPFYICGPTFSSSVQWNKMHHTLLNGVFYFTVQQMNLWEPYFVQN